RSFERNAGSPREPGGGRHLARGEGNVEVVVRSGGGVEPAFRRDVGVELVRAHADPRSVLSCSFGFAIDHRHAGESSMGRRGASTRPGFEPSFPVEPRAAGASPADLVKWRSSIRWRMFMSGTLAANDPDCLDGHSADVELVIEAKPKDVAGFTV